MERASFSSDVSPSSSSSQSNSVTESVPLYSTDDVRTIGEMFPSIDRQIIVDLLDRHAGNKDSVVNDLLQHNV